MINKCQYCNAAKENPLGLCGNCHRFPNNSVKRFAVYCGDAYLDTIVAANPHAANRKVEREYPQWTRMEEI